MTETIEPMVLDDEEKQQIAQQLVAQAREAGIDLVGPGGLLTGLTKQVLETALEEELTDHLGDEPGDRDAKAGTNERNGTRGKTVLTDIGPVTIDVPRDGDGTLEPVIVKKRQRRLQGVDELVLSLTARGLTTGEISAHVAEVYGASIFQGHGQSDHREGHRRDGRLAAPALGSGLPGGVHRRDRREDP